MRNIKISEKGGKKSKVKANGQWLKVNGNFIRDPCGSPVSCNATAQVGVTESCLDDRTSPFVTGIFYPTEYIRILHLSLHAALSPLPLPCMVFLRGFLKRHVVPHFVTSALASGLHCAKCALRSLMRDFYKNASFLHYPHIDKGSFSAFGHLPPV